MDIRNLLTLIWRKLWLIVLTTFLAGTAVYLGMSRSGAIPRYSARTVVAIGGDIYEETPDAAYVELADTMMTNLLQLARLEIVTGAVVRNLNLPESPDALAEMINVSQIEGTNLLSIRATHADPETAVAIANEIVNQFRQLSPSRWRNFVLVVESAQLPTSPDQTAVLPIILTSFTAALFAAGVIFLNEYFRRPFYDERDVAELLGLPTLFSLKPVPFLWWNCLRGNLLAETERVVWWSLKEACRQRLDKTDKGGDQQTILMLSSDTSISHAYVAAHLALAWATEGQKTVLADIDLMRADATRLVFNTPPEEGFVSLGRQPETDPARYLQAVPNRQWLKLLSSKPGQQHLSTGQLRQAIDTLWKLSEQSAVTVISAPAAGMETLMAASRADLVLLVIDTRYTRYEEAAENIALLAANGVAVDGVVLADLGTRIAAFSIAWRLAPYLRRLYKRYQVMRTRQSSYQIGQQT